MDTQHNDHNNALSTTSTTRRVAALGLTALAAAGGFAAYKTITARRARARGEWSHADEAVKVEQVTTINRPVHEVYQFWRSFDNFPTFMRHLTSVESLGGGRSRWRAKAPAGMSVEWEAELLEDREDDWIAWRSIPGSGVENSGSVRFKPAPGARGTEVRVQLQYRPPAGAVGRGIAWLFGKEPQQQVQEDLHRVKQLLETGEIAISDGPSLTRAARPDDQATIKSLAGVRS